MAKIIFKVFFNIMKFLANSILGILNPIVATAFPSFSNLVSTFNGFVNTYITNSLNYFFHILPPNTRFFVIFYLTILVSYYTITLSVHAVLKIYTIIKNIKIW